MAIVLALLAAFSNALSAIFQRIGVQSAPAASNLSLSLITYALRRWIWLLGLAMIALGFVLQAIALRFGQLSTVQPIVTTELLFLVLVLGVWFRYHVALRDWCSAAAAAGGLAGFLVIADPGGGDKVPGLGDWLVVFAGVAAIVAVAVALSRTGPRWFRASVLGAAGATMFALSAALTKVFTTLVTEGWGHVFTHWEPYALVAAGLIGLFLSQSAYHAGPITASQATLTIVDPLLSVVIGIWLFDDRLQTHGWRLPAEIVSMIVLFTGVFVLSQSPLVAGAKDDSGHGDILKRQPRHRARPGGASPDTVVATTPSAAAVATTPSAAAVADTTGAPVDGGAVPLPVSPPTAGRSRPRPASGSGTRSRHPGGRPGAPAG